MISMKRPAPVMNLNSWESRYKCRDDDSGKRGVMMQVNNKPTKPVLLLTPQQAAEALAISPRKLWGMTASGEIPHARLGRCVRYPVDDLQRWINDQTKGGNAR